MEMCTVAGNYVDKLPDELLLKIFDFLDIEDLALNVRHVNSRWQHLADDEELWKYRVLEVDDLMLDNERVRLLQNMPSLRSFTSTYGRDTHVIVDALVEHCKNIRHIHMRASYDISFPLFEKLINAFPNIETLNIPFLKQVNAMKFTEIISMLPKLTGIEFMDRYTDVSRGILRKISENCPSLKHVNLGDNAFPDEEIRYLLNKKQLQLKSFTIKRQISGETFKMITQCKNLELLHFETHLSDMAVPPAYIKLLTNLTKLKSLALNFSKSEPAEVVPDIFKGNSLSKVTNLDLYVPLNEKDVITIFKNCPQIVCLGISCGEEATKCIGYCKNLESLHYSGCPTTTPQLIDYIVASCPKLRLLNLACDMSVNDEVLLSVMRCKELHQLNLSWSNIDGKYWHLLPTHLPHLRKIYVHEIGGSDETWDLVQKQMPNLKIIGREFVEY